jgi:tetratricopeptide (TPR) repeat protein
MNPLLLAKSMLSVAPVRVRSAGLFCAVFLQLGTIGIAQAGDPFRATKPQPIGPLTESAFKAMFQEGNYLKAAAELEKAQKSEAKEPLVYSLLATMAFLEENWGDVAKYSAQTKTTALQLKASQPLRSSLYQGVGTLMEAGYNLSPAGEGTVKGVPRALGQLQEVYSLFNGAKQIDAKDPELNLIQGFMDLLVATKLPLANANDAIDRLQKNARPSFMADWGIAIGKRDQKKYDEAIVSVDRAIAAAPTQPELHYLKGQILYLKGKDKKDVALFRQAQPEFRQALSKSPQLAKKAVAQLFIEACQNQEKVDGIDRPCRELAKPIRQVNGRWGPLAKDLPQLEAAKPAAKPSPVASPSAKPSPTVSPTVKPSPTASPAASPTASSTVKPSPTVSPRPLPTMVPLPKPLLPR